MSDKEQKCQQCQTAPATERWGGTRDSVSLARNPGLMQWWCLRCVLTAQVAHMRPMVERLAEVERHLAALDQVGSAPEPASAEHSGTKEKS